MDNHAEGPVVRPNSRAQEPDPTARVLGRILRLQILAACAVLALVLMVAWLTDLGEIIGGWVDTPALTRGELTIVLVVALILGGSIARKRAKLATAFLDASQGHLEALPLPASVWRQEKDEWFLVGGNSSADAMTHGRLHSLMGRGLHEIYSDQPEIISLFNRCAESRSSISEEMDFTLATTGEKKHGEVHCSFVPPASIIVVTRDLTAQHEAEQHLLLEKRRFEAVVEQSPDCVAIIDTTGTVKYISPSTHTIFGYSQEEIKGEARLNLVHPEDRDIARAAIGRAIAEAGRPVTYHLRAKRKDGRYRWIEHIAVSHLDDPVIDGVVIHMKDVTDDREAQLARDDALKELETLHDTLPIGVAIVDELGIHRKVNRRYTEMFRVEKEKVLGLSCAALAEMVQTRFEDDTEGIHGPDALSASGDLQVSEVVIQPLDGSDRRRMVTTLIPLENSEEEGLSLAVVLDVTEQRFMEERIRRSERLEAIGRLSGGIAHDFNNLLLVIRNYLSLVSEKIENDKDALADAEQADLAAVRAGELVRQLLTFTKREAPSGSTDLKATVREMLQMLERIIGEDIALETDLGDEPWFISLHRSEAEQILMNLVVNGRDAMPSGGHLKVTVSNESVSGTKAYKVDPGDYVCLTVSDSGTGIPPEIRDKIFDPFFTTKGSEGGTGLGLSTVYGIVYNAGGFMTVESLPGHGATISAYLPRRPAEAPGDPERIDSPATTTSASILVVEDDPQVLALVQRVLNRAGYAVRTATSSSEALQLSEDVFEPIDLLLSDVVMPGMSGPDLAAHLKKEGKVKDAVLMSGYLDGPQRGTSEDLLMKPFTINQLLHKIEERLVGTAPRL